jgi:hypothetical protein
VHWALRQIREWFSFIPIQMNRFRSQVHFSLCPGANVDVDLYPGSVKPTTLVLYFECVIAGVIQLGDDIPAKLSRQDCTRSVTG